MYKELVSELTRENRWVKNQPPCSENAINNAEKEVGYAFPGELRALLLEMNGDNFLILSVKEIVEQTRLNRKVQATAAGIITATTPIPTGLSMKRLSISGSTKNPAGSRSLQALRNLLHGIIMMRYSSLKILLTRCFR